MRVIAGEYRSRVLKEVATKDTRETKDRVKEAIFNSINNKLIESKVLDLFAGSGSMGIEALSRGASNCDFNDIGNLQIKTIKDNINTLKIGSKTAVLQENYLALLENTTQKYDIILLDPPYHMEVIEDCIKVVSERKLLTDYGVIVCLYSKNVSINFDNFDIMSYKDKKIGITKVSFLKWRT